MKLRTLIVDDEPLARERLKSLLKKDREIELVGEAGTGTDAVEAVRRLVPDLLFLDVQMPELDGFGVVESLGTNLPCAVVFVTAFDHFAVKAFEVHAVDYLLKPFDAARLAEAVRRVRQRIETATTAPPKIDALLAEVRPVAVPPDRLLVKADGRVVVVLMEQIDWVESADNYVVIRAGKERHMQRETLAAMEAKLPPDVFVRISRSHIVNLRHVKELQPLFHGEYCLILNDGSRLTLTRTYREALSRFGIA